MSNQINPAGAGAAHLPVTEIGAGGHRASPAGQATGTPAGGGEDSLALTHTAATLQKAVSALAQQPVVDANRVQQVREAIASGQYQANPTRIATKVLGMEKALGAAARGQ